MSTHIKVLAIVGSYRKGGIIDTAVDEMLFAAREAGAETSKIYLIDRQIEYCTNCRACTQQEGRERGHCPIDDDMRGILDELQSADAMVIGSPMNCGTVTAVMKTFIERLVCFAWWPWGKNAPRIRDNSKARPAVVVASSAAPAMLALFQGRYVKLLKEAAGLLGAHTTGVLFVGLAAKSAQQDIGERSRKKARRLGVQLVSQCRR